MVGLRLAIVLVALGAVSAHEFSFASFGNAVFEKAMALVQNGIHLYEKRGEDGHHHGDHHKHWHDKMRKKMQEAHACHKKCGTDAACHSKCPKPWAPFVKACQDFPAIKACHSKCTDAKCDCPKFDLDWMNKKFAKHPERAIKKAEAKCPMLLEAHACHKACGPGDFECHQKCRPFHGHHDGHHGHHDDDHHHHNGWHHHGHHHDDDHHHHHGHHHHGDHKDGHHHGDHHKHGHGKMRKKMQEAHACHKKCGTDAACHSKCPKPWAPFVKACQDWPAIKACHVTCQDAECGKCPKFDMKWMNKKFAKHPKFIAKKAETMCPMIEKAHACHKACSPGDFECHHKCHSFHGHHGHHHDKDEDADRYGDGDSKGEEDENGYGDGDGEGDEDGGHYGDGDGDGDHYGDGDGDRYGDGDGDRYGDGDGDEMEQDPREDVLV